MLSFAAFTDGSKVTDSPKILGLSGNLRGQFNVFHISKAGEQKVRRPMVLRLNNNLTIENPIRVPAESVERLRLLLSSGATAHVDAHRENFYEIENGGRVFWIHVSPISGHVVLLATWEAPLATSATTVTRAA
jgi:hypothetical protein